MTNDNTPQTTNNEADSFDPFRAVQEFYDTAGVKQSRETAHMLIVEEAGEVLEAATALLKELADLEYVVIGAVIQGHHTELPEDLIRAMAKVSYLFEVIPEEIRLEAIKRVHESNMSKLTDGVMVRDEETGKILKGPNYQPPDLSDLI